MRICRYEYNDACSLGFYYDDTVVPIAAAAAQCREAIENADALQSATEPVALLPHGRLEQTAHAVHDWLQTHANERDALAMPVDMVRLLRPIEMPGKVLLLAGNYAAHVRESGEVAVERAETFPYVFMKPPTTFNDPNASVPIPRVSPDHIDYECELGVVIGKRCKHVAEANALDHVAGYLVVNDISDRCYRPTPNRKERKKDVFFDWLHGKWHDGFCPMGPCVASSRVIPDPQSLTLTQHINGVLRQNASTARMIFPVAAVIAFISQSMTLAPGDVIATGTPEGIGMPTGQYLRSGDTLDAAIENIGILHNVMTEAEAS